MHQLPPLIQDLAIMLVVAGVITLLFQKIRQPVVLGYLVAGIIIGPYTPPGLLVTDVNNIKTLSELGVIFLMFSLGLEFSFHKLLRIGVSAGIIGIFEVVLMVGLGFASGKLMGWSNYDCLFLGSAIAISSSVIIVKALNELHLLNEPFAELISAVSVVDDLIAILLLVFLSTLVQSNNTVTGEVFWAAGKLIYIVLGWFLVGYFIIPTVFRHIMKYASDETITVVSVGLCLLLVTLAAYFNYSNALGAFIMGAILAETPLIHRIENLIKPLRDIFVAVFFISVGMLIDPRVIIHYWPVVIFVTCVTVFGKILGNGLGSLLTGQNLKTSVRVGFGMAQIGEFAFIIIGLGLSLHVINPVLYPVIVAVAVITAFATPYFIRYSGKLANNLNARIPKSYKIYLENYSNKINHFLPKSKQEGQSPTIVFRVVLNGILVAFIFGLVNYFFLQKMLLAGSYSKLIKTLFWFVAALLSSPFLWGMLSSFKKSEARTKLQFMSVAFVVWVVTFFEIMMISINYQLSWLNVFINFIVLIVIISLYNKNIDKVYLYFENNLIKNVTKNT